MYCEEKGIKYLHGIECYMTKQLAPKVRDNYHTILIAKNDEGIKEINSLIELSTREDHMYYKPRITFDEFFSLSDNVFKISACLQSPLSHKNEIDESVFDRLCKSYDYYEVQYHDVEDQKNFNKFLYELSSKYNKPLIAATDTHSINKYKAECRKILMKAKRIEYTNEDEFDLTMKTYSELVDAFKKQNAIDESVFMEAINNTNKMADMCSYAPMDTSIKYPIISENDKEDLLNWVRKKYKEKLDKGIIDNNPRYADNIKEELRVFDKVNMSGFMLFMSQLCTWAKENGIPFGTCRGSVGGSTVAYITDIIDVDPIKWNTIFSRFCNEFRTEVGDIDTDWSPDDREKVYKYIIDRFGEDKTAYIVAFGTITDKATIDEVGRALNIPLDEVKQIKQEYEENPEKTREKWKELFYYFDGMLNTVVSQGIHPAGIVASPITLPDNYGVFHTKEGLTVLDIDMEEVHECGLVKYDILGLKNIGIIRDCCRLANLPYPNSHEINWEDQKVWSDMITSPVGIFQFEGSYAFDNLKKFTPHSINDMSLVNAALRPSGASYRDDLLAHHTHKNPSEIIDDLLKENYGFLVYQEDTIAFLQKICGLTGSEADNVRRAIGRKQKDRLEKALPQILEGYCSKSPKPKETAEKEAKEFLQIIEDSSNYQFGYNHSTGYSMIGYLCAYYRYYYPLEFVCSYLNNAKTQDDIIMGTELAKQKGIEIKNPKFRHSIDNYFIDRENNVIYKGISSIKFLNENCAKELYNRKENQYNNFIELLVDLEENSSINSKQLKILIMLDFFEEFGKTGTLIDIYNEFSDGEFKYKKTYCEKTKTKRLAALNEMEFNDYELSIKQRIEAQNEYVGSPTLIIPELKNFAYIMDIDKKHSPKLTVYGLATGKITQIKTSAKTFSKCGGEKGDIIGNCKLKQKQKQRKVGEEWVTTNEFEWWLESYEIQKIG
jgi:DNA polymerase-3 subunit alpha